MASHNDAPVDSSTSRPNRGNNGNHNRGGRRNGRGHRVRGRGRNNGRGGGRAPQQQWPSPYYLHQQWAYPPYPNQYQQWSSQPWKPWATPPCLASLVPSQQEIQRNNLASLVPSHLYQSYVSNATPTSSYALTNIQASMHTLSLSTPDDQWYMDTGATSHMTANADNDVSVEFDPFGFSVKDFQTEILLMRFNSSGDLYLIATRPPNKTLPPSTFVALSTEL
ncbi:uncharacterized protein LOC131658331 [Vicia villosa]|uniref:uncharacterized protein LOC131658331 n=1 Tax=Vicia villosa TaxID=3911 RepID=UPI00273B4FE7|nr:uncharacterized protein LOC131658331 [Vicia villosa]